MTFEEIRRGYKRVLFDINKRQDVGFQKPGDLVYIKIISNLHVH